MRRCAHTLAPPSVQLSAPLTTRRLVKLDRSIMVVVSPGDERERERDPGLFAPAVSLETRDTLTPVFFFTFLRRNVAADGCRSALLSVALQEGGALRRAPVAHRLARARGPQHRPRVILRSCPSHVSIRTLFQNKKQKSSGGRGFSLAFFFAKLPC